jgi:hypothetical protein
VWQQVPALYGSPAHAALQVESGSSVGEGDKVSVTDDDSPGTTENDSGCDSESWEDDSSSESGSESD